MSKTVLHTLHSVLFSLYDIVSYTRSPYLSRSASLLADELNAAKEEARKAKLQLVAAKAQAKQAKKEAEAAKEQVLATRFVRRLDAALRQAKEETLKETTRARDLEDALKASRLEATKLKFHSLQVRFAKLCFADCAHDDST